MRKDAITTNMRECGDGRQMKVNVGVYRRESVDTVERFDLEEKR
jgi:hypothetical protein